MAKLKVVNRGTLQASMRKLEARRAQDPLEKELHEDMERRFTEEKARRDNEHASRQAENPG